MKQITTLVCTIIFSGLLLFSAKARAQAVNEQDSLALVDLYNNTDGPHWFTNTNWLTTQPVSTWAGVVVANGRVIDIFLDFNQLTGTVPTSIGNLTQLQWLKLDFNTLTGTIPAEIGNLINLEELDLYKNQFSGSIPASFMNLTNLTTLNLQFNVLSGPLPSFLYNMHALIILSLAFNQFTGPISPAIGRLTKMQILSLQNNQFTGPIPDSVCNLILVDQMNLSNNQLSGSIPAHLGNLTRLENLYLNNNQLTGKIPASIGSCTGLTALALNNNKLTGSLTDFNNLKHLASFDVSFNRLSQNSNIVFDASLFPFLRSINVSNNGFTFNGLESLISTYKYKINYVPQATIRVHQNSNALSVSAGGTLSNNTYTWFKTGIAGSTVITGDSVFQPSSAGRYYVKVTNAIATRLKLQSDTITYTPIALSQNNRAAKTPSTFLSVYPNPLKDNNLHIQVNGTADISIINVTGKVMLTQHINRSAVVNTTSLAAGIYYVRNNNNKEVQRFEKLF